LKLPEAALTLFAALLVAGCGASTPRPETTIAGAVTALNERVGELEEARADIVRARRRNLEALRRNTERTRTETASLVGAWRLAGHDERMALYEGVLAATRGDAGAQPAPSTRRIPILTPSAGAPLPSASAAPPAPSAPEEVAGALVPSAAPAEPGADRARLAAAAQSLAVLGAQRSPFDQVFAYVLYLQAVRGEIQSIEQRARGAAKDAARGVTITGGVGASR
jgi:hypothetical protein